MSNINNLTSKIMKDAEDKKAVILADAKNEKSKIINKKQESAKASEKIILEKAQREAISRKERIISGAQLQARNEKLEAKQKVIKEVFELSVEALCNAEADDLKGFVKETILNSNVQGQQNLILNDAGKKVINGELIAEINKELGEKARITLSEETGNFKGGFILEKGGIEINNTFEALVNSLKDDLSLEVAKVLFD